MLSRDISLLFSRTFGTSTVVGWFSPTLQPPLPSGKTLYPLYRRLGGPQGRSGRPEKISSPPGFVSRTVQPVVKSLYRLSYPARNSVYFYERKAFVVAFKFSSFYGDDCTC